MDKRAIRCGFPMKHTQEQVFNLKDVIAWEPLENLD